MKLFMKQLALLSRVIFLNYIFLQFEDIIQTFAEKKNKTLIIEMVNFFTLFFLISYMLYNNNNKSTIF